jgi:redox-sensitive bicupin YhaK (pirin superfamily)
MIDIIRSADRGAAERGWLKSRHTFSFADYHNPDRMGFASLRVINEDWIEAGKGFDTHPHRDMEIVTYMLAGELMHKDSMGNGSVIRPGELQRMTAGTGVLHSEYNPSPDTEAHLLQIWILPEQKELQPGYEQKLFAPADKENRWCLVGSRDGRDGSLTIHQDVSLYSANLAEGAEIEFELGAARNGFLHLARGAVEIGGEQLQAGDAVAMQEPQAITVRATEASELLLFDLA